MDRRTARLAAVLTVVLTALSLVGVWAYGAARPAGAVRAPFAAGCSAPALQGATVRVVVADMRSAMMMGGRMMLMRSPASVPAGTVSFLVANRGTRTHELVVLRLPRGMPAGARGVGPDDTVAETGSLGEASRSCGAGGGDGIAPGRLGWVTLTLAPGRYELLCNLPGHYAAGMYAELDVA